MTEFWDNEPSPLQTVHDPFLDKFGIKLFVKRDDLLHQEVSGNKWRKLKYNILEAKQNDFASLLTFGGAYSNHIAATAAAGKLFDLQTIGIIRGDELTPDSNPTLRRAKENGMKLIFVSRTEYEGKIELAQKYGQGSYVLPEGGTNLLAARGASEIMDEIVAQLGYYPNYVTVPLATGGTFAGLCTKSTLQTRVLGFTVIKNGEYLLPQINDIIATVGNPNETNYDIFWDFHCGGYAKTTPELLGFIDRFQTQTGIEIEPVYSGKMFYWLYELINRNGDYFEHNQTIVAIHTGGLQGKSKPLLVL